MAAATWIFDKSNGRLTVEGVDIEDLIELAGDDLEEVNCAQPLASQIQQPTQFAYVTAGVHARINKVWFGSVVEGPGRRNVVQFQGCPIRCPGCYVPETHDERTGSPVNIFDLADQLCSQPSDGVTILGGEPFAQPEALFALVCELKKRRIHVLVYSGYTLKALYGRKNLDIDGVLSLIDMLIDGPYVQALSDNPGEYRGSRNQRVMSSIEVWREINQLRQFGELHS